MSKNQENNTQQELQNSEETGAKKVKKAPAVPKKTPASTKRKGEERDPEETFEEAINKTGSWLFGNAKVLLIILAVVVVGLGLYFGYKYVYMADRAEKAAATMFVAEQQFQNGEFALALSGDGNNPGFLEVIDNYGCTPQANIARHYAGICYMKEGDLDNALTYLSEYKTTDGAPNLTINAQNFGLQGDIHVQKGEYDKAAELFQKAVDAADNVLTTPTYLKKLGLVYAKQGKNSEAVAAFQRVADQYPASMEAMDIEKYIGLISE